MLNYHKMKHCRIDGDVRSTERQRALATFNTDPQQNILLMTIGTGAVGLVVIPSPLSNFLAEFHVIF